MDWTLEDEFDLHPLAVPDVPRNGTKQEATNLHNSWRMARNNGRGERIRTSDPLVPNQQPMY
jgi:hypothetical protein